MPNSAWWKVDWKVGWMPGCVDGWMSGGMQEGWLDAEQCLVEGWIAARW